MTAQVSHEERQINSYDFCRRERQTECQTTCGVKCHLVQSLEESNFRKPTWAWCAKCHGPETCHPISFTQFCKFAAHGVSHWCSVSICSWVCLWMVPNMPFKIRKRTCKLSTKNVPQYWASTMGLLKCFCNHILQFVCFGCGSCVKKSPKCCQTEHLNGNQSCLRTPRRRQKWHFPA